MTTPYPAYGNSGYQTAYPVPSSAQGSYGYAPPNPAYAQAYSAPAPATAPAYGVTPNTGGYAYSPPPSGAYQNTGAPGAPYIPSPPKPNQAYIVCFAVVVIVASLAGVIVAVVNSLNSNDCDTVDLNKEIRRGDDYVGVIFTDCPSADAVSAFTNAAQRWSDVISENRINGFIEPEEFAVVDFCSFLATDLRIDAGTNFDHLIIVAETVDIDGVGNILAAAAPCAIDDNFFPILGGMKFDNADIDALDQAGTLEAVILHEMGHVLGIGTLWSSVKQGGGEIQFANEALIQDPIFNINGFANTNNVPKFLGQSATSDFSTLSGSTQAFVPVEDGRDAFGNFFFNVAAGEGLGSIDGHWKITTFENELMVFAIDPNVVDHPLSSMTINSLQDLGYGVDVTQADGFALPANQNSNLRGSEAETNVLKNKIFLGNDIPSQFNGKKLLPSQLKRSTAP